MSYKTRVDFTNLGKLIYPDAKITKARVLEYYVRMAPRLLPLLRDRPLSLKRYPDGAGSEGFFEKNAPRGMPTWVNTFRVRSGSSERVVNYVVCNDLDTLLWLANLAALEIHIPLSTTEMYDRPDLILFDLDPEPPAGIEEAREAALLLKESLEGEGLKAYPKTSGRKGIHVLVPILRGPGFKETREFVHKMGKRLSKDASFVRSELSQTKDAGSVFIDYLQNAQGRTVIAPYSLRATPEATVSMPLAWDELRKGISPGDFTLLTVPGRFRMDPWADLFIIKQKLGL